MYEYHLLNYGEVGEDREVVERPGEVVPTEESYAHLCRERCTDRD